MSTAKMMQMISGAREEFLVIEVASFVTFT